MEEIERLVALERTGLMHSPAEDRFDRLTRLAAHALNADVALITLLGRETQYFKSRHNFEALETSRDVAFCNYTIQQKDAMVVLDSRLDPRFASNPLVCGQPNVIFYAGYPLVTKDGHALGSLCVISHEPREVFSQSDRQTLKDIAATIMTEIESEAQQQQITDLNLVNEELQHRMGNMYAHVSSLISLIGRSGGDQKDFIKRIKNRISILAETQALLAAEGFQRAQLVEIFNKTIEPFVTAEMSNRIEIQPQTDFFVTSRGAFTLTLMLNELVTNAIKHGALKGEQGTVCFTWERIGQDIRFIWKETLIKNRIEAHSESEAPEHTGFGSQILTKIVPLDFQGTARHDVRPEGLRYEVLGKWERVAGAESSRPSP